MEDSISAFECSLDMSRVAYVAADVRHAAVLDKRQQHVEHSDAVLLRFLQKHLNNASAYKAAASCNHNNRARGRRRGGKNFKFD